MTAYPPGWANAPLDEMCTINPRVDKNSIDTQSTVSFVPMPAVEAETGKIDVSETRNFGAVRKGYTPFRKGDVLFAKITPCMENGKMAVVPDLVSEYGFGSTEFHVLRPAHGIDPRFLYHAVSNRAFRFHAEHNMTGAVGQKRVPATILEKHEIGLPPANEQRRIVERIETLFDEIDRGVESLRAAKKAIGLYRQSLLKAAFEGRLTADWRAKNPDKLESPGALLGRIREERGVRYGETIDNWERALAEWRESGEKGKRPAKPKHFLAELASPDQAKDSPRLPNGWAYFTVGSLCRVVRGGSPRPAGDRRYYGGDIPFLKVADLTRRPGKFVYQSSYSIKEAGLSRTRQIEPETLMISNSGATLGVPKICKISATFNDGIAAFLGLGPQEIAFHYWFWTRMTPVLRMVDQGAAQPNLNTLLLSQTVIPQCSLGEQAEIVRLIDDSFEAAEKLDAEVDAALTRAEALRQSILKKAFSGQLVPQDPTDEPAAVLLQRIEADGASQTQKGTTRKREARIV